MAYSAPSSRSTGFLVTAPVWNQDVVSNVAFLANPPACRVSRSGTQSIPDNAGTIVQFNAADAHDTDNMHDPVTNNTRITFNTAGVYVISFSGYIQATNDLLEAFCDIRVNAAAVIQRGVSVGTFTQGGFVRIGVALNGYKFAAGDYVDFEVFQDNAANVAKTLNDASASASWIGFG